MSGIQQGKTNADETELPPKPKDLTNWLIAHGMHWVTKKEISEILQIPEQHVPQTVANLRKQGKLFTPTPGAYVPIPPEYQSWGSPPATHFVHALMNHLDATYYVGFLSAAELIGVAHQRPQVFQVVTNRRIREHSFGRVCIRFLTSARATSRNIVKKNTPTGTINISSPETTVLDLITQPRHGAGLSNVVTVILEMFDENIIDLSTLFDVAQHYPAASAARIGYVLDTFSSANKDQLDQLAQECLHRKSITLLNPHQPRTGTTVKRWNIVVNERIEPDL